MNIQKVQDELFQSDNYTEEANPLLSAILNILVNSTDWGYTSTAINDFTKKITPIQRRFFDTLTEEQQDMYRLLEDYEMELARISETEYFNRGFKLSVCLMSEVLGLIKNS